MISSTMPSAKYSCSRSPLRLSNGRTAMDGLLGSGRASPARGIPEETGPARADNAYARIGSSMFLRVFRPRSVKDAGELPSDCFSYRSRNHDATRLRSAFQTSGNVDCRAEKVTGLIDHIAKMDADADLE